MFTFYEIGGKVRDEILGLHNKDIDYVAVPTIAKEFLEAETIQDTFMRLVAVLTEEGYQIFLVTPDCYTIRAKFPKGSKNEGMTADFVLARKEIGYKEGTREPIVVPGTLYDDMIRRDFTVNAMARDENGEIIDFFGGLKDLKQRVLRTPIRGQVTFEDDPLRLLRAIRFAVTKGMMIDIEIDMILHTFDYEGKFEVVSEERIREELYKAFKHDTVMTVNMLFNYRSLMQYIFKNTKLWLKPTNEN